MSNSLNSNKRNTSESQRYHFIPLDVQPQNTTVPNDERCVSEFDLFYNNGEYIIIKDKYVFYCKDTISIFLHLISLHSISLYYRNVIGLLLVNKYTLWLLVFVVIKWHKNCNWVNLCMISLYVYFPWFLQITNLII